MRNEHPSPFLIEQNSKESKTHDLTRDATGETHVERWFVHELSGNI